MGMSSTGKRLIACAALALLPPMMLGGCETVRPSPNVRPPVLSCPDSARQEVPGEPAAPAGAQLNPEADRWVFGELLPWARGLANRAEETKNDCEARQQVV